MSGTPSPACTARQASAVAMVPAEVGTDGAKRRKASVAGSRNEATITSSLRPNSASSRASVSS